MPAPRRPAAGARDRRRPGPHHGDQRHLRPARRARSTCWPDAAWSRGSHASLQASLDWSVELLPQRLRRLYARLSVFDGPADADTIAAVVGESRRATSGATEEVIDDIAELADNSLLAVDLSTVPTRYRMLAVIRLHAHRLLVDDGEEDAVRDRHTAMVAGPGRRGRRAAVGRTTPPGYAGSTPTTTTSGRRVDHLLRADPTAALSVCTQVWWYWLTGSRSAGGTVPVERVPGPGTGGGLEAADDRPPGGRRAGSADGGARARPTAHRGRSRTGGGRRPTTARSRPVSVRSPSR